MKGELLGGIVRAVARRPRLVLSVVAVLALAGAGLALRLDPSVGTDTLVDRSSSTYRATQQFKEDFGDDAVIVLIKGNLQRTILTPDLARIRNLEGCLSGNAPVDALPSLPRACTQLARSHPAKVVYGPATFLNRAAIAIQQELQRRRALNELEANQIADQAHKASAKRGDPKAVQNRLAATAKRAKQADFQREILSLALRTGLLTIPSISNPDFVSRIVFATETGRAGAPKARFGYLFPSENSALIQVRLRAGLSDAQRHRAIELIKQATGDRRLQPTRGAHYVVTGVPVVANGLASAVQHAIFVLLVAALLVMAATLALVFPTRLRLLPLALALAAAAMTFGALSLAGGSLTMASIAVLPVLIGLAVDYAIQFQARFDETRSRRRDPSVAAQQAAVAGGPTIATAGLATAVGFLVLLLSPIPMVRGFGGLLVLGIGLALAGALTAGFAALVRYAQPEGRRPADLPPAFPRLRRRIQAAADSRPGHALGDAAGRVRDWAADVGERGLSLSLARPRQVLAIGLAVAVLGWLVDTQSKVDSDVRQLVPQNLQALKDARELQDESGVSGEIDVTVRARDITRPAVIDWMSRFQASVLRANGYRVAKRDSCRARRNPPDLCPALSLPELFQSVNVSDQRQVNRLLDSVPAYFSQGVVTRDRKVANLAFGIHLMPLDRQRRVVDSIKQRLKPPPGVQASVVGLPVLVAEANGQLASPARRDLTLLAALAGVFLVLLAVRRSRRAAAVPLIPIALATGWSGAVVFILGLLPRPLGADLNPMSVTLGALVVAISTEFSVLLSSRYAQERAAGAGSERALALTYGSTGAAVLASGATAIAGFAVLMVSNIRMLHDFGVVTVVDLTVSLLGVMLVLPAALVWAEEHGPFRLRDLDPRPLAREAWSARPVVSLPRPRLRRRSSRA